MTPSHKACTYVKTRTTDLGRCRFGLPAAGFAPVLLPHRRATRTQRSPSYRIAWAWHSTSRVVEDRTARGAAVLDLIRLPKGDHLRASTGEHTIGFSTEWGLNPQAGVSSRSSLNATDMNAFEVTWDIASINHFPFANGLFLGVSGPGVGVWNNAGGAGALGLNFARGELHLRFVDEGQKNKSLYWFGYYEDVNDSMDGFSFDMTVGKDGLEASVEGLEGLFANETGFIPWADTETSYEALLPARIHALMTHQAKKDDISIDPNTFTPKTIIMDHVFVGPVSEGE